VLSAAEDGFVSRSKDTPRRCKKLVTPLFDPVGVNINLLSKLTKCLFAANSGKGNLRT
jgi:hypothetical protein